MVTRDVGAENLTGVSGRIILFMAEPSHICLVTATCLHSPDRLRAGIL